MTVFLAGVLRAATFDDRVERLFRPPLGEWMALSPEGRRVAYSRRSDGELTLMIIDLDHPGQKRKVAVDPYRAADFANGKPPVQLRFLRWATPNRLVFAPTAHFVPLPPVAGTDGRTVPNPDGPTVVSPIMAVDADGNAPGALVDARDFTETPEEARRTLADLLRSPKQLAVAHHEPVRWRMPQLDILGFHPTNREQLILETRGAYSMPRLHLVDVRTGSVREYGDDWSPPPAGPQVFDWFRHKVVGERRDAAHPLTTWQDDDLGRVQRELEIKFPRRSVELLDWSDNRARVLFRVTGGSDPGRIFVFQRPENLALEILHRTPWLTPATLNETRAAEWVAPDGVSFSGYLTWPKKARGTPPPLLVVFPSGFPGRAQPEFDPEAQVFADLGFAVVRLNHRHVAGVKEADLATLRSAVDRVSIDDALVAIEGIAGRNPDRPFDRRRIATLGRGFGGYLALRALQLHPTVFRCGVAIDAPLELHPDRAARELPAALLAPGGLNWETGSVLRHADALTNPVLLLGEPARRPEIDRAAAELEERLRSLGRPPVRLELDAAFAAGQPASRAAVYRQVGDFVSLHVQPHAVKIGPAKEVP